MARDAAKDNRRWGAAAGAMGAVGSLTCAGSMAAILVTAGAGAAGASTGMAMGGSMSHLTGFLGGMNTAGPTIQVVSVVLVAASFALRRLLAAGPALIAGGVLYWGMYDQTSTAVMYVTLAIGFAVWVATYLWTRQSSESLKHGVVTEVKPTRLADARPEIPASH